MEPSNAIIAINDENIEIINLSNITTTAPTSDSQLPSINDEGTIQNFHLVWLDEHINKVNDEDYRNSLFQLHQVINAVDTFVDVDESIDFITDNEALQIFLTVPEGFAKLLVPIAQEIRQINFIYILCRNKTSCEKLAKKYNKVKGIFSDITSICQAFKHAIRNFDPNSVSISFVKANDGTAKQNLDSLDKSFMYTQILKEILLTIDFEEIHSNEFLSYCRQKFVGDHTALKNVELMAKEYRCHPPIWWYTYDSFLYWTLNTALRLMKVDIIIKMGFFLKDLHNHIVALHSQQFSKHHNSNTFIAYRGQGLSQNDFLELQQTQGGLLSFNNFLSTSLDRLVSLAFAESILPIPHMIGVVFQIIINPSINSTQFANAKDISYYKDEEEILFSMHSVFRIGQIKQINGNTRLWEVDLILTSDNDPQLHKLTEYIRQETFPHIQGWYRLGNLLFKLGEFDKAEQVCDILLGQTTDEKEKGAIYHMFGMIKGDQGKYEDAVKYYKESIQIKQKYLSPTPSDLASSYNNLGLVYANMGEYSNVLSCYEKALEIYQKTLPENHPHLATAYNNIGLMYDNMGENSKALSSHEKALEIWKKTLPENHPHLATSYNNIGLVYNDMGEYSKALSYYEKALEIRQKTLPENHPNLAISYNNIGVLYHSMGEYSKALSSLEKALEIEQKTLPENHPHLATAYNNIGLMYNDMGENSKALSYYEKALEILKKTLPENHPHLATSYSNIGLVYNDMGEYSKALSYYEKALEIRQKTLPENHPHLAISYNNIAKRYGDMKDYRKALQYLERALDILQHSLPSNHPHMKIVKESIEIVKKRL